MGLSALRIEKLDMEHDLKNPSKALDAKINDITSQSCVLRRLIWQQKDILKERTDNKGSVKGAQCNIYA